MGRTFWLAVATLGAALVQAGCDSSTGPELPGSAPAITGPIVARNVDTPTSDGRPTIHVKEIPNDPCGIIFALEPDTEIARRTDEDALVAAAVDELTVGLPVRVWARGGIAESCPAQGVADAVEILR